MDLPQAISHCRPGAAWILHGNDYDGLVWRDTASIKPTMAEIESAWAELSGIKPPVIVSMRSFRKAMGRDLMIRLSAAIAATPDVNVQFDVKTDLEYSETVARANPLVAQFAAILGKTAEETDAIFAKAQQLDTP